LNPGFRLPAMRWFRSERGLLSLAFVLHVAITFWVALHHEVWADEGDPWLLMRDADAASILRSASNGGVPLLFHLSLLPFARLGFPYFAQQFLNLLYVWGAVALVLRSRAFAWPVKVLFAFSYYPGFEFAIIPRPYGLQMLLTFAMAEGWAERRERPVRLGVIVALLANTSTLGLITAAVAGVVLLWERIPWRGLAIPVLGGLVAAAQLWPREGRQQVYTLVQLDTVWFALASMFFPDMRVEDAVGGAVVILGIVFYGISRSWKPVFFLGSVLTALMLIYVFIWMGGLRHAGLLTVAVVAAVWIADSYGPYRRERLLMAALAVAFAVSVVPAYRCWVAETRYAFSGSREVAGYIRETRLEERAIFVSHQMFWTSPLVYVPGMKIWYPARAAFGTYGQWERRDYLDSKMPLETVLERAHEQLKGRRWVLIVHRELPDQLRPGYRLLYRTKEPIWRMFAEQYLIYEPLSGPSRRLDSESRRLDSRVAPPRLRVAPPRLRVATPRLRVAPPRLPSRAASTLSRDASTPESRRLDSESRRLGSESRRLDSRVAPPRLPSRAASTLSRAASAPSRDASAPSRDASTPSRAVTIPSRAVATGPETSPFRAPKPLRNKPAEGPVRADPGLTKSKIPA
jgi:hypothetical protein